MDIKEILIRTMSGYIFVFIVLLGCYGYLGYRKRTQSICHMLGVFIFTYYLIGVLTMTGIGKIGIFQPTLVLVPFMSMIEDTKNTILNIILFIPLGLLLPLLYHKLSKQYIIYTGLVMSLIIEAIQMFGLGATDINDIITNMLGTYIGYMMIHKISDKITMFRAKDLDEDTTLIYILSFILLVMITVQPIIINKFFHLG